MIAIGLFLLVVALGGIWLVVGVGRVLERDREGGPILVRRVYEDGETREQSFAGEWEAAQVAQNYWLPDRKVAYVETQRSGQGAKRWYRGDTLHEL